MTDLPSQLDCVVLGCEKEKQLYAKIGVNKRLQIFVTVWHGFREFLKASGTVNMASINCLVSSGFFL